MHAQRVEHSEALGVQAQPARAEVERAQLKIKRNRFALAAAFGKLALMAIEYRGKLPVKKLFRGFEVSVWLCGHVICYCFYRRGRCAVPLHYALVGGKVSDPGRGFADVQVIGVALAFHLRIGAEYDVGLKIAHDLCNGGRKLASVVKAAVAKRPA